MNNRRTFELYLDYVKADQPPIKLGSVKQLDGTTIIINALNGDKDHNNALDPMDLRDCVARLYAKKANGEHVYQKDNFDITMPNKITFYCADEIFSDVGIVNLEVEVIDLDGYIVTSPTMQILVVDKINDLDDREVIYAQEVGMLEELKDYVVDSAAKIDAFQEMLGAIADPSYTALLEQLISTQQKLDTLLPTVDTSMDKLQEKIDFANSIELEISSNEKDREASELIRESNEEVRVSSEAEREKKFAEWEVESQIMFENEAERVAAELLRVEAEELRAANEDERNQAEFYRVESEISREANEMTREANETERLRSMELMRDDISAVQEKVEGFQKDGNFDGDVVAKGNIYPTLDGIKPTHFGPPTKNAGNVLMPYARAIGGFTKDGSGVRTIGFVAKPMDANPDLDITEEQNTDAVFLGTNVSQLFLYSKEKYPTIVSEGELSPIATQDWVMRLVEGLGLLAGTGDVTPVVTSALPSILFNQVLSEQWSTVSGEWRVSDEGQAIMLLNGEPGLYKPMIGNSEINEVTYVKGGAVENSKNDLFMGMWKTQNYIYGCRISGRTLNISYFGTNGVRGGANSFTLREEILPGDTVTMHYNFSNDIWEIYKFDPNNEPILVYQMSKFMMSGFPEFLNGRAVEPTFSVLVNTQGGIHFMDCPNPDGIRDHSKLSVDGYIF